MDYIKTLREIISNTEGDYKELTLTALDNISKPVALLSIPNKCENCNSTLKNGVCPFEEMHEVWEQWVKQREISN